MADEGKGAGATKPGAVERATNCASCNKRLSRKKRYYRHGAYFCNKRCFKAAAAKAAEAKGKEEAKPQAASPADATAEPKDAKAAAPADHG